MLSRATASKLNRLQNVLSEESLRLSSKAERLAKRKASRAEETFSKRLDDLEERAYGRMSSFFDSILPDHDDATKKAAVARPSLLPRASSNRMEAFVTVAVLASSLGNVLGVPSPYVLDLWEKEGFADEFVPFQLPVDKRVLSGMLELVCGLTLAAVGFVVPTATTAPTKAQREACTGLALAAVTLRFGRGSRIHFRAGRSSAWPFPALVATLSASLLLNRLLPATATSSAKPATPKKEVKSKRR